MSNKMVKDKFDININITLKRDRRKFELVKSKQRDACRYCAFRQMSPDSCPEIESFMNYPKRSVFPCIEFGRSFVWKEVVE